MRPLTLTAAASFAALIAPLGAAGAQADSTPSYDVTIVHGLPSANAAVVDVYVDDELRLDDFAYTSTTQEPLRLEQGDHIVTLTGADAAGPGEDLVHSQVVPIPGSPRGSDYVFEGPAITLVVQVDADNWPDITAYSDDTRGTTPGMGMVVFRHAAALPSLDVTLSPPDQPHGWILGEGTVNGWQASVEHLPGTYVFLASLHDVGAEALVDGLRADDVLVEERHVRYLTGVGDEEHGYRVIQSVVAVDERTPEPSRSVVLEPGVPDDTETPRPGPSDELPTAVPAGEGPAADTTAAGSLAAAVALVALGGGVVAAAAIARRQRRHRHAG